MVTMEIRKVLDPTTELDPQLKTLAELAAKAEAAGVVKGVSANQIDDVYSVHVETPFHAAGYTFEGTEALVEAYGFIGALYLAAEHTRGKSADVSEIPTPVESQTADRMSVAPLLQKRMKKGNPFPQMKTYERGL